ncbi:MAG: L-lysine 6-transaminase [Euryarchaeota archaeon]|jgi:L-lysine 6-transaminase|nr:L-lysine 6-transaminase [Euryarchaeota archaeon]MDP6363799.1 L-lysine 6-transaminase [Candidatus Poseidoniia archaeon]MDP6658818.1 L-lysine 6-transaminase [Candidatus Poseidoniia archaeon]MDP6846713.1 L-lysine 6-transaminase [Candidatus Poseidoniia archaeon]MDP7006942.1 L-lysine 6-transaminase [Candidatus Poseidoniia archaeon]|tara:strand:- start:978 stop:2324 length:1347 start_codon:yes stop_codon:yes gene_type:complete
MEASSSGAATTVAHGIAATDVHEVLRRYQLVDGYDVVLDLERSHGAWLYDARTESEFLDCFTCFASWPVGYNHPMLQAPEFLAKVRAVGTANPANSDIYTREMAGFVEAFATRATPPGFPYHFWVAGGALAVENALKVAFDWKARKLGRTDLEADVNDLVILHLRDAFHGRSGYTLSLTNTVPDKIGLFPKFDWPRVHNPTIEFGPDGGIANDIAAEEARACAEIEAAFAQHDDRIAAIILEPLQGEGGDNHFRPEFFEALRGYADSREALLIYDEVQTGFWGSGKPWFWQHHGVAPDIVAFGKKTQVCGIYCSERIDEVADNVFQMSGRINSTFGGNLMDMVRCHRFLDIIEAESLGENAAVRGAELLAGLRALARETGGFSNVRGVGSLIAFTLPSAAERDALMAALAAQKVMALKSGSSSIRFRLPLVIAADEIAELLSRVRAAL